MSRPARSRIILIAVILLQTTVGHCDDPLPSQYLEKVDTTPDFCQVDHRFGKFPGNGDELCGPVALSNALVFLNQHGFPKLIDRPKPTPNDQADLIRRLCSHEYLDTNLEIGTNPKKIVLGIEKFFHDSGYECKAQQMGWRSSIHRIGQIPDQDWMLRSCMGTSNLLINVGWYKTHDKTYRRSNGHWVTLVGFREEKRKRTLLIHDPSGRSGMEKKTEPCHLVALPANHHLVTQSGETINAEGYYQLKGIRHRKEIDLAIVDGAIAFAPTKPAKEK